LSQNARYKGGRRREKMSEKSASHYFHGKEKYNCAQAISKAFQSEFNISDETIKSYKNKGGGKAEGGICGSLFAAKKILNDPEAISRLERLFIEQAGSLYCKEIRKLKKVDCRGTVALAENIIIKKMK